MQKPNRCSISSPALRSPMSRATQSQSACAHACRWSASSAPTMKPLTSKWRWRSKTLPSSVSPRRDPKTHAAYHLERGRDLLNQGFTSQAEKQFREALQYDARAHPRHAGSGAIALESSDPSQRPPVKREASLNLQPSAEAYLVLARLALAEERYVRGRRGMPTPRCTLEPSNSAAQALQRSIESKTSEAPAKPGSLDRAEVHYATPVPAARLRLVLRVPGCRPNRPPQG